MTMQTTTILLLLGSAGVASKHHSAVNISSVFKHSTTPYGLGYIRVPPSRSRTPSSPGRGEISKVTANKMVVSKNGTWLLPFWKEAHTKVDKGPNCAGVLRSADQGETWTPWAWLESKAAGWLIENSLAPLADGRFLMVFRTRCGKMYNAYSSDDGLTWDTPSATPLDNPNAKIAMFRRNDGPGVVLAYNPSHKSRTPLALAITEDGRSRTTRRILLTIGPRRRWATRSLRPTRRSTTAPSSSPLPTCRDSMLSWDRSACVGGDRVPVVCARPGP